MVNSYGGLDIIYAALADPTRRRMIERLRGGDLSVSELAQSATMTLAAVGKHISVLESAGIIRTTKTGRVRSCTIVPGALTGASVWLEQHEHFWMTRLDALSEHVEENP